MRICAWLPAACAAGLFVGFPAVAGAQNYEDVGTRAQGMAGAFVAVADDASASWWNPAGLASGAYFNVIFEKGRIHEPDDPSGAGPASRTGSGGFAAAFPALGVSYYRLRFSEIQPTTDTESAGRQELGGVDGRVRARSVRQFGATIGQSIGGHIVLGSTLKVVRAGMASAALDSTGNEALDAGDDLELSTASRADLDVGAMASFQHVRFGLSVRNVTKPHFGEGADRLTLNRLARAGIAVLTTANGTFAAVTLAADVDLTRHTTLTGEARRVASGAEVVMFGRRLSVRGGISSNTLDDDRGVTTTTGVSFAPVSGLYIEGARVFGADESLRGWSSTVRLTF